MFSSSNKISGLRRTIELLFLCLAIFTTMNFTEAFASDTKLVQIEPGVFDVPLVLPKSLESRREEFRQDFIEAQKRLRAFATKYGWEKLTDEPFVKQLDIFDTKDGYDNRIYSLSPETKGKPIPATFSAGIEQEIFFAVTPEICDKNFPEGIEKDGYIKLMVHELAHRLHVRIVKGEEEKMGPIWFFEGFAVNAADQYSANTPKMSKEEMWAIVGAKERGSYRKYKAVFTHFLKSTTLQEFTTKAGQADFIDWLKSL